MICPNCDNPKTSFQVYQDNGVILNCDNCNDCQIFLLESVVIELNRLTILEKIVGKLHFELAINPTFQDLTANDEKLDGLFCDLENVIDFDKLVENYFTMQVIEG